MARPSPTILASTLTEKGLMLDVLASETSYLVVYDGKPITLRREVASTSKTSAYPRMFFAHPAHAHREADKMNRLFQTDRFSVIELDI